MLGPDTERKNVWYLPTAPRRDGMGDAFVRGQVEGLKREFKLGRVEIIDVEYVKGEALKRQLAKLESVDVIYADMGNTYNLRHHLRNSGGDQLVRELMEAGTIFIGSSAGSIVAGRTIQMAFWKGWDDRTAEGTINVDWTDPVQAQGLDLGGGRSFFPHANGRYGDKAWQDEQAKKHGHDDHEVIKLADGQGFVIDGARAHMAADEGPADKLTADEEPPALDAESWGNLHGGMSTWITGGERGKTTSDATWI